MELELAARQLLRALRGPRSQAAFSRRLGYASNVAAKWESGRRMPVASEVLRACGRVGVDVAAAFTAFRSSTAPLLGRCSDAEVAAWLTAQRGGQALSAIAARAGCSRYRVSRFLGGQTRPRLPEFLALVQALTGRLPELVAQLVPIERVPALLSAHQQMQASRQAAFVQPWSSAVLALLATSAYRPPARASATALARTLGIPPEVALECLTLLRKAGVLASRRGRYQVRSSLVVDTRNNPGGALALREHWARASYARLAAAREADLFSYHLFAVSRADHARMRQLQLDFFQQLRAIAAESQPSEVAGLLTLHLLQWDAPADALEP